MAGRDARGRVRHGPRQRHEPKPIAAPPGRNAGRQPGRAGAPPASDADPGRCRRPAQPPRRVPFALLQSRLRRDPRGLPAARGVAASHVRHLQGRDTRLDGLRAAHPGRPARVALI